MRKLRIAAVPVLTGLALCGPAVARAATETPASAAAFRDSIGVNTHVSYYDTAYGQWDRVLAALEDLGVTHVRDGISNDPTATGWMARYNAAVEATAAAGIRFDFIVRPPQAPGGSLDDLMAAMNGNLNNAVDSIESPNEYDLTDQSPGWADALRTWDQQIYDKARSLPNLSSVPILGPSLVYGGSYGAVGDVSGTLNFGNIHPYTGAQPPSAAILANILGNERLVAGSKPVMATEAGFHNAMAATSGQPPTSEQAAATYLLRTYLVHFKAGIARTYAYELMDEKPDPAGTDPEQHFGLLRNDFTPKPAYFALKNLLAAIGHPPALHTTTPLDVSLAGQTAGVDHLLLQDGSGSYKLVVWQNASVWNPTARQDVSVPSQSVDVDVPGLTSASLVRPEGSATQTPLSVQGGHVQVSVLADPVVVDLAVGAQPGQVTITSGPPPSTTATSADFTFSMNPTPASFECRVDALAWHACASPATASGLSAGAHTFSVRALDDCEDQIGAAATWSWTVLNPPSDPAVRPSVNATPTVHSTHPAPPKPARGTSVRAQLRKGLAGSSLASPARSARALALTFCPPVGGVLQVSVVQPGVRAHAAQARAPRILAHLRRRLSAGALVRLDVKWAHRKLVRGHRLIVRISFRSAKGGTRVTVSRRLAIR